MKQTIFPKNFLWGASTAAHQVEGGNDNQWALWERANAERLARTAERRLSGLPDWPAVKALAEDPANYISGNGVEHYSRYKEDFSILEKLNMNAFRFGIEWARIEPKEGQWDEREIEHYRSYIEDLRKRGIEPVPTLWHWTLPTWFASKGGFAKKENVKYFERFASKIAQEFASSFRYVLVLNEPNVYLSFSYLLGQWPPESRSPLIAIRTYVNLALAHKRAYAVLKEANPKLLIGIALHMADTRPANPRSAINRLLVALYNSVWNWWFADRIRNTLDVFGVNFYHTSYITWSGTAKNPSQPVNDLGWYMEPSGLERICAAVWRRYHKPLLITESGVADDRDTYRKWWLEETISAMERVIARGIELHGYLHWSLLDNFEWAYGWWPHFGLVAVDRKTMKRTIRSSAHWLAEYIGRSSGNKSPGAHHNPSEEKKFAVSR